MVVELYEEEVYGKESVIWWKLGDISGTGVVYGI